MGTRNLTCVVHEGNCKVTKYKQWDTNPTEVEKVDLVCKNPKTISEYCGVSTGSFGKFLKEKHEL